MAVLALVLTGGAWQWTTAKNNRLNNVAALDPNSRDILDPNAQFGDENFLIVGVDSRLGENADMGAGNTERRRRRPLGHRDAGQHPRQPQTRGGGVLPPRPGHHADEVRGLGRRATASTARSTTTRPRPTGPTSVYTETKLNSAYAFGGPKCLVKVIQKISGLSINRFMAIDFAGFAKMVDALGGVEVCSTTPLEDYELGTVLPTAGRQIDRRAHRAELRPRPAGHHRVQRRLRPHQAPADVPVLAAAVADLQGHVLLAEQAQQRREHVHQRQLRRQHPDQGPRRPRPVDPGRVRRTRHVRHACPPRVSPTRTATRCRERDDIRALFDAIINDDPLPGENDQNETTTPVTTTSEQPTETTASTDQRRDRRSDPARGPDHRARQRGDHRARTTSPCTCRTRPGETGLGSTASTELQQHGFNVDAPDDYPEPLDDDHGDVLPRQRAGGRHRRRGVRQSAHRAGDRDWVRPCRSCSARTSPASALPRRAVRRSACRSPTPAAHTDRTARGPDRHQRRRHHLRIAPSVAAFTIRSPATS